MKKLFLLLIFTTSLTQAQFNIKGTAYNSYKDLTDALLYKIEGAKQLFINNTTIKEGKFNFELPANTNLGVYRVVFNSKNGDFIDFLFNKEDVVFSFDPTNPEVTIQFEKSLENKRYKDFLKTISLAQYTIDSLQIAYLKTPTKNIEEAYKQAVITINNIQNSFNKNSEGMLVYHFIKATDRYNAPTISKSPEVYFHGVLTHFFDQIDFENKFLYNSSFLIDRITDYVFYMNYSKDQKKQEELHKNAVHIVLERIKNLTFKKDIIEFLITQFVKSKNIFMTNFVFENYFNKLPVEQQNLAFKEKIMSALAVEIGSIAPDFSWTENNIELKLSELSGAKNYVLVFWSTGCPHCTKEIPKLYEFTKSNTHLKVIAFAMEKNAVGWSNFKKDLPNWHHVLGLGKWENKTAKIYQIYATPSYFVLDANKKIIAKPEKLETLKTLINNLH